MSDPAPKPTEARPVLTETTVKIPGLKGSYRQIAARYDYASDACRCPACGTISGVPWRGWFMCDGSTACRCVALVADGRAFVPEEAAA